MDKVPIYLYYWHVLKTWHLRGTEKIKDVEVRGGILQDLHDVMYMSINHGKTIDDFKKCGSVRQLLSLYLRFYKVTMLESTNATDEGRMRMYV